MAKKTNGQINRIAQPDEATKLREAEELLAADRERRTNEFMVELRALCQKYGCDLSAMIQVTAK